jgi:hypothetical protein
VLLLHRKNIHSFDDLKLVNDTMHKTYQDACNNLGLLVNDYLYNQTLKEASLTRPGFFVCQLFGMMCIHTPPSNPKTLLKENFKNFTDDVSRVDSQNRNSRMFSYEERRILALFRLSFILTDLGLNLDWCGFKLTPDDKMLLLEMFPGDRLIKDPVVIAQRLWMSVRLFNPEQKAFFGKVTRALAAEKGKLFYLDGPGGSGKTFLLNALIDYSFNNNMLCLVVASTGVASLLLKGGRTAHSTFKIPIPCNTQSHCSIEPNTQLAQTMRDARFLIWEKVVTVHMDTINAVNLTLQELCGSSKPFGGKVVVFAGDFLQTLPVVKFDEYPASQHATIKLLAIWTLISEHALTTNMQLAASLRGLDGRRNAKFASSLLALGEGKGQPEDFGLTRLRNINLKSTNTQSEGEVLLVDFVYRETLAQLPKSIQEQGDYLFERAILARLNKDVWAINSLGTAKLPGVPSLLRSIDMPDPEGLDILPEECLNKISISSLPEHLITLKVGMPMVITQNLYPNKGVCNGSRMIVFEIGFGYIVGRLLSGPFKGNDVMVPKIKIHHKGTMTSTVSFY